MDDLKLVNGWTKSGLRSIAVENSLLRIVVLPEAGGKIWQIT
jgi:hypothetical protein